MTEKLTDKPYFTDRHPIDENWFDDLYTEALEAIDRGWNLIPISVSSKRPLLKWTKYQTERVTSDDIDDWFTNGAPTDSGHRVKPFNLAVLTGAISGIVVVDCDNEDAAVYAMQNGMNSPYSVRTTRGRHFYFAHPMNGQRYKNQVAGNPGWFDVEGLDFRGDGGYVLMPPSVKYKDGEPVSQYGWEKPLHADWDDLELHTWKGTPSAVDAPFEGEFSFGALNLASVPIVNADDSAPIWEQTKMRVAHLGRKLGEGDGTDALMVRYVGQKVREGLPLEDLWKAVNDYHDEFFDQSGYSAEETADWLKKKIQSAVYMDRRNHPDDYDADGNRIVEKKESKEQRLGRLRPVLSGDVDRLLDTLGETEYWADPLIPAATITQVVGYNGHGKSFFLAALLNSLAAGRQDFGPYSTPKPAKIFYMDYDNPSRTILYRFRNFLNMFGDTGDKFNIWSPALISPEDGGEMNLAAEDGFKLLGEWLEVVQPDIVVIDTVRNAFGGLEEASASEWFKVNHVAKSIRTKFGASVVMVHHRNKPGEGGLGREAGSTAQLTDIDTQVMVTQVLREKQEAKAKAGLLDSDLTVYDLNGKDWSPFGYLEQRLEPDSRLRMVSQISFGKVRQQTEMHQTHYIGWAERLMDGSQYIVSTASPRQKALYLQTQGMGAEDIARRLYLPVYEVKQWL